MSQENNIQNRSSFWSRAHYPFILDDRHFLTDYKGTGQNRCFFT